MLEIIKTIIFSFFCLVLVMEFHFLVTEEGLTLFFVGFLVLWLGL
jgi:hypothetical protein